jgi:type II secretory pathway pseudopilin PulG
VDTRDADAAESQPPAVGRLRAKLPEILLEAASVVVAVLLALAVDEWRDARAKREIAARAQRSVLAELRANDDEVRGSHAANAKQLDALQRTLDRWTADPEAKHTHVELGFFAAQLSDAAWETTRTTQAVQLLPFDWVVEIARVYEIQSLYKTAQLDMLQRTRAAVAEFSTSRPPSEIVAPLRSQLQTFQSLGDQLRSAYKQVLAPTR